MRVNFQLELLLRDTCERLKVGNKVENNDSNQSRLHQQEKYTLLPSNNQESLKATVTLLDENIIQSEISLKYPKIPGGVFRSVANPNVQWKIQQLQDTGNLVAHALQVILKVVFHVKLYIYLYFRENNITKEL